MSAPPSHESLLRLSQYRGDATSCISLLIGSNSDPSSTSKLLIKENSAASNIKDRANRKHVTTALKSCSEKLKTYKSIPDNGLAIFAGYCV
ncbi:MAG: hypothetical protein PHG66_02010 [Candidatus Colwellbacteria bacterium]|nr:hypothetical protein [Candidatus Colwellbacteria bacterium]